MFEPAAPPGQTSTAGLSTATPIRPFRTTVTGVFVVLGAPVDGWKTNVASTAPAGTEAAAVNVKTIGVNEGATRSADAGVTVTPAGRPVGVTVMLEGGEQAPGARDAVTGTASPPETSSKVAGEMTGAKSATLTSTTKVEEADGP